MGHDYLEQPFPEWIEGSTEERFTRIYERRFWGPLESSSGPGSSLEQARVVMEMLPQLLEEFDIRSVLDIPCGDLHWMQHVELPVEEYIGGDIVGELVTRNREQFGRSDRVFLHLDMISSELPKTDLVLCRDGLVHLRYEQIWEALANFKRSGARYLLCTTFTGDRENRDVQTGDWRPLNFQNPPFSFPESIRLIDEHCPEEGFGDKALGLWELAALP